MRGAWALAWGLTLASVPGCAGDGSLTDGDPGAGLDDPEAVEAHRADAPSFVARVMPLVHGRHPLGSAELRVLAGLVEALEARGREGRRTLARALAEGDEYRRRWSSVLLDLLHTRRAGHRALGRCYGERGPAAESDALARFVLEHPPSEPFPEPAPSMRDLVESSLRADDLRPLLRADLLVRMASAIDDANTSADDLERARRTELGRAFEASYLGRRFECLGCHRDDASVGDGPDPALDRFWPVARGLERAVYPEREEVLHAAFRWEGFAGGGVAPWGLEGCGTIALDRDDDPVPTGAYLAGPLPRGATVLDVQARLDEGLRRLYERGWSDAPEDDAQALAQLVVLHLVDGLWAAATGRRLTLDHGTPRNSAQAERLRSLAIVFVRSQYSLRAVLEAIAVDPFLDQASPAEHEQGDPEPLPALFDPFSDRNGAGHLVHRRDPFALRDEAHRVLGRSLPGLVVGEPGFDAVELGALGAALDESRPGHGGLDLLGALSWESWLLEVPQAGELARPEGPVVTLDGLVSEARAHPELVVGDLMIATKDRILAEPEVTPDERELIEVLVGQPWSRPLAELDDDQLFAAAWRYARVLLATPQFMLAGLEQAPRGGAPTLWPAEASPAALCEHWAPRVLVGTAWECDERGLVRLVSEG